MATVIEPKTIGRDGPYFVKKHWIPGSEGVGLMELDEIAKYVAKLLKETPEVLSIKVDIRYGVEITQILEAPNGDD